MDNAAEFTMATEVMQMSPSAQIYQDYMLIADTGLGVNLMIISRCKIYALMLLFPFRNKEFARWISVKVCIMSRQVEMVHSLV